MAGVSWLSPEMGHGTWDLPSARGSAPNLHFSGAPAAPGWVGAPGRPHPLSQRPKDKGCTRSKEGWGKHRGQQLSTHTCRPSVRREGARGAGQHGPRGGCPLWEPQGPVGPVGRSPCTHRLPHRLRGEWGGRPISPAPQGHPSKTRSLHFGGQTPRVGHPAEGVAAFPVRARLCHRALYINEQGWEGAGPTPPRCPMACGALLPEHAIGRI